MLVEALKEVGVNFMVSPYEADAQLAYFAQNALVDVVISEDGDTLPYGCARVFFKMDNCGRGEEIQQQFIGNCQEVRERSAG